MTSEAAILRGLCGGLAALLLAGAASGSGGVFSSTKHGDPQDGAVRLATEAPGACSQCHDEHGSRQGASNGGPYPFLLFAPDDNSLCFTCHSVQGADGVYGGRSVYGRSSHGLSFRTTWPGRVPPGRSSSDAGKCVNCHDPHGVRDALGIIPSLAIARGDGLCGACHNGSVAASDVRAQFLKPFRHPTSSAEGRHVSSESSPSSFAASPGNNRHVACADCHNPHQVGRDAAAPMAPNASSRLLGVGRVRVANGASGTRPIYRWAGPAETTTFPAEYELCFKCHSSWTTQPAGQDDLALLFNPENPSYHPVEAASRNSRVNPDSFANGWTAGRLVYCSDCHSSDDPAVRGPHGSAYRHILKKPYTPSSLPRAMAPTELCFDCHSFATYADPAAPARVAAASRFNPPATPRGHAYHVGTKGYSCYACHETHGSTRYPALLATGRAPGLTGFLGGPAGGTCNSTCHGARTYSVNYGR